MNSGTTNQRQQTNRGATNGRLNNIFTSNKSSIEQHSLQTVDDPSLLNQQLPQFNYNPLYTSLHQQQEEQQQLHYSTNDSSNDDGLNDQQHQSQNQLSGGDDAGDLLNDGDDVLDGIYHYSDGAVAEQSSKAMDKNRSHNFYKTGQQYTLQMQPSNHSLRSNVQQQQLHRSNNLNRQQLTIVHPNANDQMIHNQLMQGQYQDNSRPSQSKRAANHVDRRRMNNSGNQSSLNQQMSNFQQQQFTLTSNSSNQLDHLAEECNGLFVEYQTNRINPLGGLEELNSLNVTNCVDSETLEEQINMLSSGSNHHHHRDEVEDDDCFINNDDLQDFVIGNTNDNFLNMLFMTNSNSTNNQSSNQLVSNQPIDPLEITNVATNDSNKSSMNICETDQQQQAVKKSSTINKNRKDSGSNKSAASKKLNNSKAKEQKIQRESSSNSNEQPPMQNKITTTNTNKRLLPKKTSTNQTQQQQLGSAKFDNKTTRPNANRTIWSASPSSASTNSNTSSLLSPSSSSQFEYDQTPYRQQLDNLRKKLKMDVLPPTCNNRESVLSSSETTGNHHTTTTVTYQVPKQVEKNQTILGASNTKLIIQNPNNSNGGTNESGKSNNVETTYYLTPRSMDAPSSISDTIYTSSAQQSSLVENNSLLQLQQPQQQHIVINCDLFGTGGMSLSNTSGASVTNQNTNSQQGPTTNMLESSNLISSNPMISQNDSSSQTTLFVLNTDDVVAHQQSLLMDDVTVAASNSNSLSSTQYHISDVSSQPSTSCS